MRRTVLLALLTIGACDDGRPARSRAVVNEFRRLNPCPLELAQGERCSQYFQIDHMRALVCGGPDSVENLAWITIEEHKAKTAEDIRRCRN